MNSTLVGKVVNQSDRSFVQQCNLMVRLFRPQISADTQKLQIVSRIEILEKSVPFLRSQIRPVAVIVTDKKDELDIEGEVIRVGRDTLNVPGILERAILVAELMSHDPLGSDVVAEFIWRRVQGLEKRAALPWFRELKSLVQYCRANDYVVIHHEFCAAQNEMQDGLIADTTDGVSPWSLKSLFLSFLEETYFQANLKEKDQILNNLIFLGEPEDATVESLRSAASLPRTEAHLIRLLADWIRPLDLNEGRIASSIKEILLSKNQVNELLIIARSSRDIFPYGGMGSNFERQIPTTAVQIGTQMSFYPSDVTYKSSVLETASILKPKRFIYVSCEIPSPESLLRFRHETNRITFVRYCEPDDIDWIEFTRLGVDQFLQSENSVQFIDFDLPSIVFAQKIRGPLLKFSNFRNWQSWLMWQGLTPDDSPFTQRPLAVIEGVKRFRIY